MPLTWFKIDDAANVGRLEQLRKQLRATEALLDAALKDNMTFRHERDDAVHEAFRLRLERDDARRVARDALVVAGFAKDWDDIRRLPEFGA